MPTKTQPYGLRRGSLQHQTVQHLAEAGPCSINATRKELMGGNTDCENAEFQRDIIDGLAQDGLVEKLRNLRWSITPRGHEALQALDATAEAAAIAATARCEAMVEASGVDVRLLTRGRPRLHLCSAESTPPRMRPNANECDAWPSRQGSRLVYRSGLVTDLQGKHLLRGATT